MKKIILSILFILGILKSDAQITSPFPDTTASWTEYSEYFDFPNWYSYHNRATVCGDTSINGNKYFLLAGTNDPSDTLCFNTPVYRIDSMKVYFWIDDTTEILKYDFGMQIGDSMLLDNGYYGTLTQIDTIVTLSGHEVTRYLITGANIVPVFWYYGIGSEYGPFTNVHLDPGPFSNLTSFYYKNDCYQFSSTNSNVCTANLNSIQETNDYAKYFVIYPNPSNGIFTIEISDFTNSILKITDASGKLIISKIIQSASTDIFLNEKPGIYFLTVQNEHGSFTKKIFLLN